MTQPCGHCNGTGVDLYPLRQKLHNDNCSVCNGTGRVKGKEIAFKSNRGWMSFIRLLIALAIVTVVIMILSK